MNTNMGPIPDELLDTLLTWGGDYHLDPLAECEGHYLFKKTDGRIFVVFLDRDTGEWLGRSPSTDDPAYHRHVPERVRGAFESIAKFLTSPHREGDGGSHF